MSLWLSCHLYHFLVDEIMFNDNELFQQNILLRPDSIKTTVNMSCSATNISGLIDWKWEFGNIELSSGDRYQLATTNSTATSTLVISDLRSSDSGLYCCSANYQGSSKSSRQTRGLHLKSRYLVIKIKHIFRILHI